MVKNNSRINNWDQLPVVLDLHTVALVFGVTDLTVKHWIYNGTIKAQKMGRLWRFDKEYIKSYMEVCS